MTSAVLLADPTRCRELDAVAALLSIPTVRIGPGDRFSMDLQADQFTVNDVRFRPVVSWMRHLPGLSWRATFPGRAPGQLGQLHDAARLGYVVPRTTVTTNPGGALRAGPPRSVVKAVDRRPGEPTAVVVSRADPPPDRPTPLVVQDFVPHDRELRAYYLDGAICGYEIRKPCPAAIWTAPSRVEVRRAACPPEAEKLVHRLAAEWRLTYAAFDLLITSDGTPVFLEANTDGDWRWCERRTGTADVTFLAAAAVRARFHEVAP